MISFSSQGLAFTREVVVQLAPPVADQTAPVSRRVVGRELTCTSEILALPRRVATGRPEKTETFL